MMADGGVEPKRSGMLASSTGNKRVMMLVFMLTTLAAAAAAHAVGNNHNHQLLRHDESTTRFVLEDVAADRELRGEKKFDIFYRKGGSSKSSKSSKGTSSAKTSKSGSSSKKQKKKQKKKQLYRKKKKKGDDTKSSDTTSDTKSMSKKSEDDDADKLVKLSIKGSGGSKHDDDDDKSSSKKSSPSKSKSDSTKKKSLSKTDVDPSKRLCNTSKERKCRDDCFKSNKCKKGHFNSPCHKKCRYGCCDPDAAYESTKEGTNAGDLCNTSEEKMCRVECFEKKKCGNDDDCQKECRQDCCSDSDKSKDSSDDRGHSKKDDGKDADDDDDKDKDMDMDKSYKPLKWDTDDIPSECQEDVDKFNSCYEKQYEDGKECYGYDAARELDDIFEAVLNYNDDRRRNFATCGDWYDFVCPIRADTDCCRNRIRNIGRCLGREVFNVGGDDCDDTCRGYDKDDKEAVGNVFDPDTFSTLVGLLTDYQLVGVLSGDDPITVSRRLLYYIYVFNGRMALLLSYFTLNQFSPIMYPP